MQIIMNKSNYQKVVEFNKTFGHPVNTGPQYDIYKTDPKLVKLRLDLIREEVGELEDAVKDNDMVETLDALADILYVVYGMGVVFGLDLDEGMGLVHESNMSKICKTEEEAIETVEWYKDKYSKGLQPYDNPIYKKSPNDKYWVVLNESSGKILKSINYNPVDLTKMLKKSKE